MAKSISVSAGTSEMIRRGGVGAAAGRAERPAHTEPQRQRQGPAGHVVASSAASSCLHRHVRRTSSHRKNGPPIIAVMIPTGSSSGASAVRDTRSQPMRKAAPNSADAGSTSR